MNNFIDDELPYRKKSKKKKPKKSNHKHDYEIVKKEELPMDNWFNYKKVCKICGKVYTEFFVDEGEK